MAWDSVEQKFDLKMWLHRGMGVLFVSVSSGTHLTELVRQVSAPEVSVCLSWLQERKSFPSLPAQCFSIFFSGLYVLCFDFPQLASLFIPVCYHRQEKQQAGQAWPVSALSVS